jgi:hypothetical protein
MKPNGLAVSKDLEFYAVAIECEGVGGRLSGEGRYSDGKKARSGRNHDWFHEVPVPLLIEVCLSYASTRRSDHLRHRRRWISVIQYSLGERMSQVDP